MREQELLHAYVDDQLDPDRRAEVETLLASDEAARAAVAAWQTQNDQLRHLERGALEEPVPIALLHAGTPADTAAPASRHRHAHHARALGTRIDLALGSIARAVESTVERLFGTPVEHSLIPQALAIALVLGLGVGSGWFGHRAWANRDSQADLARAGEAPDAATAAQRLAGASQAGDGNPATGVARGLMRDAMVAHVVYTADTRRPVEVAADDQDQLLRWLSRRLGRPLQLPALNDQGWNLVGGRLLTGDTGGASDARAQFMYQNKAGQRLTLYLSVLDPVVASKARQRGTTADGAASLAIGGVTKAGAPGSSPATPPGSGDSTAFSYASRDKTNSFYWTEGRFGYALVGELPRAALERISVEVYMQTVGLGAMGDRADAARADNRPDSRSDSRPASALKH